MKKPKLGDWVEFTHKMVRGERIDENHSHVRRYVSEWQPMKLPEPMRGVYLGPRVLQIGYPVWGGKDEGTEWHIIGTTRAALVAIDVRKKAIYVDPANMRILTDDELWALKIQP